MFLRLESDNDFRSTAKIIDTDFVSEPVHHHLIWVECANEYSKRELPVVPNLIRGLAYSASHSSTTPITISELISLWCITCSKHKALFEKYKPEIDKYLQLL
jgi:hypothetical protein